MADIIVPGPCTIHWAGNDLGATKSGIVIRATVTWEPITYDGTGGVPADFLLTAKECTVETVLVEPDKIKAAAPWIDKLLKFDLPGRLGSDEAGKLEIYHRGDANPSWVADKTIPRISSNIMLSSTQEFQLGVSFLVIPQWVDDHWELFSKVGV